MLVEAEAVAMNTTRYVVENFMIDPFKPNSIIMRSSMIMNGMLYERNLNHLLSMTKNVCLLADDYSIEAFGS